MSLSLSFFRLFFIHFLFYLKNKHYLQVRRPGPAFGRKTNDKRLRLEFISYVLSTELKFFTAKEDL